MSWIRQVPDDQWDGDLAPLHERVVDRSAMAGTGTLRKVERELIALVVSRENDCHY